MFCILIQPTTSSLISFSDSKSIGFSKTLFTFEELSCLFKLYEIIQDKTDERRLNLLSDFADVFDTMDNSWSIEKKIENYTTKFYFLSFDICKTSITSTFVFTRYHYIEL